MIELREYRDPKRDELLSLYESVGWINYTARPGMLEAACRASLCALGAFDGERLVGLVRAVGDGASVLYVQDLLVRPEYQRRGVGGALLRELLARWPNVYQAVLLTDDAPQTSAFYAACGFQPAEGMGCRAFLRVRGANDEERKLL